MSRDTRHSDDRRSRDRRFYAVYSIIEGIGLALAIAAWWFLHRNTVYLIGSIVMIALVGGTFVMARLLSAQQDRSD